jgi:hypothetical protein
MNSSLAEIILAAGNMDEEGTFWIQMLVLIVLAAVVSIISLIKARAKRLKTQKQHRPKGRGRLYRDSREQIRAVKDKYVEFFLKTAQPKTNSQEPLFDFVAADTASSEKQKKGRDLTSGMEILDLNFLVKVVEKTRGKNKKNVTMRQLVFNELARREQLSAVSSKTLNFYTINKGNIYDKNIQCEAMAELAKRTRPRSEKDTS